MSIFKTPPKQLNARLVKHLNQLAEAGLNISDFDKKKILRLEEIDVLVIQDINEFHKNNIHHYDKIYTYLQALMKDLEKVVNEPSKYDKQEKNRIKELIEGIANIEQKPKQIDEKTRQERREQLNQMYYSLNEYPDLENVLINNWSQTLEIAKAAGDRKYDVFVRGLPLMKESINENNLLFIGLQMAELSKSLWIHSHVLEFYLPDIREILNEKTLPYIVELVKALGVDQTESVFKHYLPELVDILNENTLPDMVKLVKSSGDQAGEVISFCSYQIENILNEKTFPDIIKIVKAAGDYRLLVLEKGLSKIRDILNENNLLSIGLQLVKIAKVSGDQAESVLKSFYYVKFKINQNNVLSIGLQLSELFKAEGELSKHVLMFGFREIKNIINENNILSIGLSLAELIKYLKFNSINFLKYWGLHKIKDILNEKKLFYLAEISKAAGDEKNGFFFYGLLEIKDVLTEKTLAYLVEIAKVIRSETHSFFNDGLLEIKPALNEKTLPYLVEMVKLTGDQTNHVFKHGLSSIKEIINEKTLPHILQIVKASKEHTKVVFCEGLPTIKYMINEENLPKITEYFIHILQKTKGAEWENFSKFELLLPYFNRFKILTFPLLIIPTVESQGPASFICIECYSGIAKYEGVYNEKDLELLVWITSKKQRKAPDILHNLILEGLKQNIIQKPISHDAEIIKQFLENSPAYLLEIYTEFRNIYIGTHEDKHIHYEKLFKDVKQLKKEILDGNLTKDYDENILLGTLYSVFAPEVTVDRQQYKRAIQNRQDRQSDIPGELNKLSGLTVRISKGGFVLKEEVNTQSWNNLVEAVTEINQKPIHIDPAETGMHILTDFLHGDLRNKQKEYLKYIYSYNIQLGNQLPSFSSEHETLMKYKEFIGDRLRNDLILSLLSKAQEKYKNEFLVLTNTNKDYRQFAKTLFGIWKSNMNNKENKIIEIINSKGFNIQEINWPENIDVDQINQFLIQNSSNIIDKSLVQQIFNQLYGEQYENMQKEMTKFEFKKEGRSLTGTPFKFILTKHKMHSVAMFNFGVCVAIDDKLWNQPDMWLMIILDEEQNACGGVIYRTIQEQGNTYLIASIQPSSSILASVSPDNLYKKIIQYSKTMVKKLGYTSLLIPTSSTIHSNRGSIQELINAQQYPQITLKQEYAFSYSPYHYTYQQFYIV
ncbi:hypothetical protein K9L97_00715 [Candidatus Woesearchaeota archaeon]|nr:hypothetical protein [Candidatus Woesearchaeota archaeon]